ncbi:MAG: nucleotidyltransferase family protein [Deltaproteobacteria bacterium]|nr:nucleotidyltransferase family protein [Deltaproteobacteria bacterium]
MKDLHATWESSRAWRDMALIISKVAPLLGEGGAPAAPRALASLDFGSLDRLRGHRLQPLIFREVARRGLEKELPPAVFAEIRKAYLLAFQKAAGQEAEIPPVLKALGRAGIEAIILKGADVRRRLYSDPAVRPMADLDLLIPRARLREAGEILVQMGYLPLPEPRPGFVERFENEITFRPMPGKCLRVDLHFGELRALGPVYRLPHSRLAAWAQTLDLAGLEAKVLAPEHVLIHLSLHTFQDFTIFGPFAIPLIDLSLALARLPVDWDFFLAESARFRCQGPVYLMLRALTSLPGVAVPAEVLDCLGQYRPSWPERLVLQRLAYLSIHLSVLYRHRRFSDWAFFFWSKLFPQQSYTREHCGSFKARLRTFLKKLSSLKFVSPGKEIGSS